jgi:hypothetical protein
VPSWQPPSDETLTQAPPSNEKLHTRRALSFAPRWPTARSGPAASSSSSYPKVRSERVLSFSFVARVNANAHEQVGAAPGHTCVTHGPWVRVRFDGGSCVPTDPVSCKAPTTQQFERFELL